MFNNFLWGLPYGAFSGEAKNHTYCLCVEGLGKVQTSYFGSRHAANAEMYRIMNDNGLQIRDSYNDTHDKTYLCNRGVRFYVTRW